MAAPNDQKVCPSRLAHHPARSHQVPTVRWPVDRRHGEILDPLGHVVVTIGHHHERFVPGPIEPDQVPGARSNHRGVAIQPQIEHDEVCLLRERAVPIPRSDARELGRRGTGARHHIEPCVLQPPANAVTRIGVTVHDQDDRPVKAHRSSHPPLGEVSRSGRFRPRPDDPGTTGPSPGRTQSGERVSDHLGGTSISHYAVHPPGCDRSGGR
jgi:hypothetical protein